MSFTNAENKIRFNYFRPTNKDERTVIRSTFNALPVKQKEAVKAYYAGLSDYEKYYFEVVFKQLCHL